MKISELLQSTAYSRSSSGRSGTRKLTTRSLGNSPSAKNPVKHTDAASFNAVFHRSTPVGTPWLHSYEDNKPKISKRSKLPYNLVDVERKLSSLVLNHSDKDISRRNSTQDDQSSVNDAAERFIKPSVDVDDEENALSSLTVASTFVKPIERKKTELRTGAIARKPPMKSSRHRFCLSKFPHSKRQQKHLKSKEIDELQSEVTIDQKGLKQCWEYHVLEKLSGETQCFINHRFDGKEKPKEKLVDFLDAGYRDRDRIDYMAKRKRRLFDMPYKHEEFPGASTYL